MIFPGVLQAVQQYTHEGQNADKIRLKTL